MTTDQKINFTLKSYGRLWLLYIGFFLVFGLLTIWFPALKNTEYQQTGIRTLLENDPFQLFVLGCIFAPIVEEMMFRTLIQPSHSDLILFISAWPVFIGIGLLPNDAHWLIRLGFGAVLLFVLFYLLSQLITPQHSQKLRALLHQYTWPVFIVSSFIFGLVHINNYVEAFTVDAALIALIVPRILSGFMMGWVKIKTGHVQWSMLLHFFNNVFVVGIMLLAR